ncbi:MAG: DUF3124 domain-containing protein [Myxococcota bacterium]
MRTCFELTLCTVLLLSCESKTPSENRVSEVKHPSKKVPAIAREPPPPDPAHPMQRLPHSKGQTLYVPVYSSLPRLPERPDDELSAVLSVRNTDRGTSLTVQSIDYYDTEGHALEPVISEPTPLAALESRQFLIRQVDQRGGAGANFLVTWTATEPVTEPIVETVHFFNRGNRAFAFVGRARVIEQAADPP